MPQKAHNSEKSMYLLVVYWWFWFGNIVGIIGIYKKGAFIGVNAVFGVSCHTSDRVVTLMARCTHTHSMYHFIFGNQSSLSQNPNLDPTTTDQVPPPRAVLTNQLPCPLALALVPSRPGTILTNAMSPRLRVWMACVWTPPMGTSVSASKDTRSMQRLIDAKVGLLLYC